MVKIYKQTIGLTLVLLIKRAFQISAIELAICMRFTYPNAITRNREVGIRGIEIRIQKAFINLYL